MLILKIAEKLTPEEEKLGVKRIAPIWGAQLSAGDYFKLASKTLSREFEMMTPAELGCTLSHLSAYRIVIESSRSAVILEDDISITEEHLRKIREIVSDEINFIHLAEYDYWNFRGYPFRDGIYEIDPRADFWGTAAYYVSVGAAQALMRFHEAEIHYADNWNEFFSKSDIPALFAPVFLHREAKRSIGTERRQRPIISVRRLIFRRLSLWITKKSRGRVVFPINLAPKIPHVHVDR